MITSSTRSGIRWVRNNRAVRFPGSLPLNVNAGLPGRSDVARGPSITFQSNGPSLHQAQPGKVGGQPCRVRLPRTSARIRVSAPRGWRCFSRCTTTSVRIDTFTTICLASSGVQSGFRHFSVRASIPVVGSRISYSVACITSGVVSDNEVAECQDHDAPPSVDSSSSQRSRSTTNFRSSMAACGRSGTATAPTCQRASWSWSIDDYCSTSSSCSKSSSG